MLTIRTKQRAILAKIEEQRFRDDVAAHLRKYFPEETAPLDKPGLLARAEKIIVHGREHGLLSERDLSRYAGVIVANEVDYQAAPEPEWMTKILRDPDVRNPSHRVDRLAHASIERFRIAAKAVDDREAYYSGTSAR